VADGGGIARLFHKNPDGNCSKISAPKILAWHTMANKARYSGEQIDGFVGMFKNDISDLRTIVASATHWHL
jgi:hypothetical protein